MQFSSVFIYNVFTRRLLRCPRQFFFSFWPESASRIYKSPICGTLNVDVASSLVFLLYSSQTKIIIGNINGHSLASRHSHFHTVVMKLPFPSSTINFPVIFSGDFSCYYLDFTDQSAGHIISLLKYFVITFSAMIIVSCVTLLACGSQRSSKV